MKQVPWYRFAFAWWYALAGSFRRARRDRADAKWEEQKRQARDDFDKAAARYGPEVKERQQGRERRKERERGGT